MSTALSTSRIYGTFDWKQPIEDFEFLRGLPSLEVLAFWQIITKKVYPAMLPALSLKNLKKLRLPGSYLPVQEYALLEEGLKDVEAQLGKRKRRVRTGGSTSKPRYSCSPSRGGHSSRVSGSDGGLQGQAHYRGPSFCLGLIAGKGEGRVKCGTAKSEARCRENCDGNEQMKQAARVLIDQVSVT